MPKKVISMFSSHANSSTVSSEEEVASGEGSYIDSLFFEPLPKVPKEVMRDEPTEVPITLDVEENGYIDQSYFQEPKTCEASDLDDTESVADCIAGVREQLSINQFSGGRLDFKHREKRDSRVRYDSQGFRIPDDNPIKFHLLTEDEAVEVLYKSIIAVQENLIVINKPPGIACHGGQGQYFSVDSLLPRLAHKLRRKSYSEGNVLKLTHRIDKEATGILLISRNQDTHLKLTEAFANRWISKSYLCITSGIPREKEGTIYLPISEKQVNGVYRMVARRPRPKLPVDGDVLRDEVEEDEWLQRIRRTTNAITHFNVLDRRNDAALLECSSVTGMRHQIRVHLSAALETPILGDHKYAHFGYLAPQRLSKRTLEALGIRQSKARYLGLYLHAHSVKFGGVTDTAITPSSAPPSQPTPGFFAFLSRERPREVRQFVAPLPSFFLTTLNCLGIRIPQTLRWTRFKLF
ncbi:Pseudouridine synthase domain containing protein [Echinococcus multilocularis]|uniref:Pseudouridylate synthase RPUSD4, mitochondrial n=1 Tax=Echinococcus multilocularis TaxID=6211 RepID=A0A068YFN3_ECHMU|nr:Pseudouridine synthase domain containing protein [Echinococcus multilocularis]